MDTADHGPVAGVGVGVHGGVGVYGGMFARSSNEDDPICHPLPDYDLCRNSTKTDILWDI